MRQIFLAFKMAVQNFLIAKMRMFLTILGIVIGVAAVIIVLSLGNSAQDLILGQIRTMGSSLVAVFPGRADDDGPPASVLGIVTTTLKNQDLEAIKDLVEKSHIEFVSGYVTGNAKVSFRDYSSAQNFQGVSAEMVQVENTKITNGRFFTKLEEEQGAKVAVLGSKIAEELFAEENFQGKKIKIGKNIFRVVGVLEERGSSIAGNFDQTIYMPLKTAQDQMLGIDYLNFIRIKVDKEENLEQIEKQVEDLLRDKHDIPEDEEGDFSVRNMASAVDMLNNITDFMKFFLTAVAGISLLVGGIGVMNIMFITLHKRIREIGLRVSCGARSQDIILQFLVEANVIALIGGILGILLGLAVIYGVAEVAKYFELDWNVIISGDMILLAVGISLLIGMLFGLYPAFKASKVSPMEALRHE